MITKEFRAWHSKRGEWLHGYSSEDGKSTCSIIGETILLGHWMYGVELEELKDVIVDQFTGKLDFVSRKIFENDIVDVRIMVKKYFGNTVTENNTEYFTEMRVGWDENLLQWALFRTDYTERHIESIMSLFEENHAGVHILPVIEIPSKLYEVRSRDITVIGNTHEEDEE